MNTKEEYLLLQEEWYKKIMKSYVYGGVILAVLELIIAIITIAIGANKDYGNMEQLLIYFVLPAALINGTVLITNYIFKKLTKRESMQYALTICLILVCFYVAAIHGYFISSPIVFVAPQILTVIFDQKRFTLKATIIAAVLMVVSIFIAPFFDKSWEFEQRIGNCLLGVSFLIVMYVICILYISYGQKKNAIIISAANKQDKLLETLKSDQLTGLINHTEFYKILENVIDSCNEKEIPCALGVMDIDNFKKINDTYGHLKGNIVLVRVAEIISEVVGIDGVVARYGGEEFTIILPGKTDKELLPIMNEIRKRVKKEKFGFATNKRFSISGGIAELVNGEADALVFFDRADGALYEAKNSGKDRIEIANKYS